MKESICLIYLRASNLVPSIFLARADCLAQRTIPAIFCFCIFGSMLELSKMGFSPVAKAYLSFLFFL